jgi:hypothetical protein
MLDTTWVKGINIFVTKFMDFGAKINIIPEKSTKSGFLKKGSA